MLNLTLVPARDEAHGEWTESVYAETCIGVGVAIGIGIETAKKVDPDTDTDPDADLA
jgi:hypothetical protein